MVAVTAVGALWPNTGFVGAGRAQCHTSKRRFHGSDARLADRDLRIRRRDHNCAERCRGRRCVDVGLQWRRSGSSPVGAGNDNSALGEASAVLGGERMAAASGVSAVVGGFNIGINGLYSIALGGSRGTPTEHTCQGCTR